MKPRFRTIAIWSLICANLFVGLLAYFMRDNLFRALIEPGIPFQVDEQPAKPDYNDAAAWAIRPQTNDQSTGTADVFFVHPTTAWRGSEGWNADIADPVSRTRLEKVALPNFAEPFASAGAIWAPRYRQAVLYASLARREDSREALDFAYQDVARAFAAFEAARDAKRPFVLAGVGQGSLHLLRLLQEQPKLTGEAKAVYLLDQPIPTSVYSEAKNAGSFPQPCKATTSTHCFVSYTPLDGGDSRGEKLIRMRSIIWTPDRGYHSLNGAPFACVNPLTGNADVPDALASANRGSAAATGLERNIKPALLPSETGARCRNGLLLVEVNRPASLSRERFTLGTFYKITGYNLFYDALARDVENRVKS